jgi:hypothetical protein
MLWCPGFEKVARLRKSLILILANRLYAHSAMTNARWSDMGDCAGTAQASTQGTLPAVTGENEELQLML